MTAMTGTRNPHSQSGVVLYIALIFLVLLTVMAVTTFTVSKGTQQVIGNQTNAALVRQVAAQTAENAISSTRLIDNPNAVLLQTSSTGGSSYTNNVTVDVNGDGKTVINARLTPPKCVAAAPTVANQLNLPHDQPCVFSAGTSFSCYDVNFGISVVASDPITNATANVGEGLYTRAQGDKARNICKNASGTPYF